MKIERTVKYLYIKKTLDGTIYKGTISYNLDKTAPKIVWGTDGGEQQASKPDYSK